jgi:hypothetical protein
MFHNFVGTLNLAFRQLGITQLMNGLRVIWVYFDILLLNKMKSRQYKLYRCYDADPIVSTICIYPLYWNHLYIRTLFGDSGRYLRPAAAHHQSHADWSHSGSITGSISLMWDWVYLTRVWSIIEWIHHVWGMASLICFLLSSTKQHE